MTGHAAPFYCPYCGEETIRPFGELDDPHGQWRCTSCRRAFRVKLVGLTRSGTAADSTTDPATDDGGGGTAGSAP